jgi:toxin ParE1/3/4
MGYRLTTKAEEDVVNLFLDGAAKFGLNQAENYHHQLETCFDFLNDNPRAAPATHEFNQAIRVHPFKQHIILYQIQDDRDLLIIRVRHARENWQTAPL